jgi:CubicO group peptidase (beta-lactamase class C family)
MTLTRDSSGRGRVSAAVRIDGQPGPWTRQQFLDAVLPDGLLFAPGERFSYSNVGYMLLIDIMERVTGRTFARLVDDFIIQAGVRRG